MKANVLNYHLAEALLQLIRNSNGSLYGRFNLLVFSYGCVTAPGYKIKDIEKVADKINLLRSAYEPEMDTSPYTYEKRIAFEIELDKVQGDLLKMINDHQLVNNKMMQEIMVGKWSKKNEE